MHERGVETRRGVKTPSLRKWLPTNMKIHYMPWDRKASLLTYTSHSIFSHSSIKISGHYCPWFTPLNLRLSKFAMHKSGIFMFINNKWFVKICSYQGLSFLFIREKVNSVIVGFVTSPRKDLGQSSLGQSSLGQSSLGQSSLRTK